MAAMLRQWGQGAGEWAMMLSMGKESMSRITMGRKALCTATLREVTPHSLWVHVPWGLMKVDSVALSFAREGTGHRSQYSSGAIGQGSQAEEVGEGEGQLLCVQTL